MGAPAGVVEATPRPDRTGEPSALRERPFFVWCPGYATVEVATRYGALFFAWSDAPVRPADGDDGAFRDPFGF